MGQGFSVFISAVTREFGAARDALADALQARGIDVKVQRSFGQGDGTTLALLHDYIRKCDRAIAVIGAYAGLFPPEGAVTDRFRDMLPPGMTRASLTQWEVIFARHYRRETYFFEADGFVPEQAALEGDDTAAQAAWRRWLFDGDQGLFRRQFQTADGLRANVMELDWRNPAETKPSNLPGSIGHFFKGREEFLDGLRESFKRNAAAAITSKAVHGLGGVGKTRTAIEFGHASADDYVATFFLTGKSESDLNDSLAALAGAAVLDLPERNLPDLDARIAAVIRWLRANPGWLLIIDNADDPAAAKAARAFLAQVSRAGGHILITSRLSDWGNMVEPLELDLLSVEAATDLLRESTPHRTKRADEDEALARLADEQLGCLSLALVQAAAYIESQRIGFADYSERFERETAKLLDRLDESAKDNLGYPLSVAATWQTSFEQLSETGRRLLEMLAWLSIEPIPRSLFAAWPQADTIDLDKGLAELTRYNFVQWEAENSAITLHRLVAQVTRDNLDDAGRDRALDALFPWLLAVNPTMKADDVRCWPELLPLLPHALFLFKRTSNSGPYAGQTDLYGEYALLLRALARYSEAEPLYRGALEIDEVRYGPDHRIVASRLSNLSVLLLAANRLTEAERLCRRAVKIDEASQDPDHPGMAARLVTLAELLRTTNRPVEAEPLYHRAIKIDESCYGPDHPEVALDLNNLAGLFRTTNRLAEAEALYRRALTIQETTYGTDHLRVAAPLNNLAGMLQATDRLGEAEPLYRRAALILLRSSKASGHLLPNTATALDNYSFALTKMGREIEDARAVVASVMSEAGFDPAELWPQIFGGDD